MIDSVLESVKKGLGVVEDAFDEELVMHINSVFSTLYSIGASPPTPFFINGSGEKWSEFLGTVTHAQMVKSYMVIKVRLVFDVPATSFAIDALKQAAAEWEWRLGILEFDFNPLDRPIYDSEGMRVLKKLDTRLSGLEYQVNEIDEEIQSVPELPILFQENVDNR